MAVQGNLLEIYSDNPNADVALGYDQAGTFNEKFRVNANGSLALSGNAGSSGQVLQSNGGGAATWASATNAQYNSMTMASATSPLNISQASGATLIPGLSNTVSVS